MKTFSFVITAAICLLLAGFAQAANKDNKNGTIADDAHGIVWLKTSTVWAGVGGGPLKPRLPACSPVCAA